MVISASRRTDIPAWYHRWMMHRLRERYVLVRNPVVQNRLMHVSLHPGQVTCIVFWTKDISPLLDSIKLIQDLGYFFYVQHTLNFYGRDIEPEVPDYASRIESVKRLCDEVGPECIVWRYDPVIISPRYPEEYHIEAFRRSTELLKGYIRSCVFSFVDIYPKMKGLFRPVSPETKSSIALSFSQIARECNLALSACAEEQTVLSCGIAPSRCIDPEIIEQITGDALSRRKDPGQRATCSCIKSIDIGSYGSCLHGCLYCYASSPAKRKFIDHHEDSPLLEGYIRESDILKKVQKQPR